jgi:hypothetical protein
VDSHVVKNPAIKYTNTINPSKLTTGRKNKGAINVTIVRAIIKAIHQPNDKHCMIII